ncbi:glycosyltransferase family 2 protein [Patescibacteria group bacterium]|nr:glycosyltransferase family 2 protein [Patescibacteria group bacterium]MBU1931919.1 glycosyltransferase family 2 protein [Patescibacteria group bacterium]
MKKLISIIIPAFNEEANLLELSKRIIAVIQQIKQYGFEIIVIENGSWDNSFNLLSKIHQKDKRFKILQLSRNFGCDGAITAGLKEARGEAAVIMMADLQDPPEMLPKMLKKWEAGFEIVYGIVQKRVGVSWIRDFNSRLFYKIANKLTSGLFPENASDFRLLDKKVYQAVNQMDETNKFFRGMVMWTGFKKAGIPFKRPPRFAGEAKSDFKTVLKVATNGIFSFSYFPLKVITGLGFILALVSFVLIIFYLTLYLIYGRIAPGHTSTIVLMLFLFGMLFLILGVIGEYLARIYDEVKGRPNFIVKTKIGL